MLHLIFLDEVCRKGDEASAFGYLCNSAFLNLFIKESDFLVTIYHLQGILRCQVFGLVKKKKKAKKKSPGNI